jgi:hypothetical protein
VRYNGELWVAIPYKTFQPEPKFSRGLKTGAFWCVMLLQITGHHQDIQHIFYEQRGDLHPVKKTDIATETCLGSDFHSKYVKALELATIHREFNRNKIRNEKAHKKADKALAMYEAQGGRI